MFVKKLKKKMGSSGLLMTDSDVCHLLDFSLMLGVRIIAKCDQSFPEVGM